MLIFGGLNYVINGTAAITVIVNDTYPKIKKVNICPEFMFHSYRYPINISVFRITNLTYILLYSFKHNNQTLLKSKIIS